MHIVSFGRVDVRVGSRPGQENLIRACSRRSPCRYAATPGKQDGGCSHTRCFERMSGQRTLVLLPRPRAFASGRASAAGIVMEDWAIARGAERNDQRRPEIRPPTRVFFFLYGRGGARGRNLQRDIVDDPRAVEANFGTAAATDTYGWPTGSVGDPVLPIDTSPRNQQCNGVPFLAGLSGRPGFGAGGRALHLRFRPSAG